MAIKKKDGEELSKENILHVISLLEADTPITKKEACQILKISYNTSRLNKIIAEFKTGIEIAEKMRAKMRAIPIDKSDEKAIISEYLTGISLTEISENMFRSVNKIKGVLVKYNIPLRTTGATYHRPIVLPDESISEDYIADDLVYSAKYNCPAIVKELHSISALHGKVYKIWLLGKELQFAYQPYYELGNLTNAQKTLGITL